MAKRKNAAAVELGKLRWANLTDEEREELARAGGLKGGVARREALSAEERSASAKKAAAARWGKKAGKKKAKPA